MSQVNPHLVEKYQLLLEKDPNSQAFAPLVEAYRKMGLLNEALSAGKIGVGKHPNFAGGRIALAKVYIENGEPKLAEEQLKIATRLAPENILAFSLLADTLIRLKQAKEALSAYKMLLFLNPKDKKAQSAVKKLESLTADEFDDEVFELKKLGSLEEAPEELSPEKMDPNLAQRDWNDKERVLSLVDAFIVRNEFQRANHILQSAETYHSNDSDFIKRQRILKQFVSGVELEESQDSSAPLVSREQQRKLDKIEKLKMLLSRVADRANRT